MAMHNALSIREIVDNVVDFIPSQADLYNCAQVNSTFAAASLYLLWRSPQCHTIRTLDTLLGVLSRESRIPPYQIGQALQKKSIRLQRREYGVPLPTLPFLPPVLQPTTTTTSTTTAVSTTEAAAMATCEFRRATLIHHLDFRHLGSSLSKDQWETLTLSGRIGLKELDLRFWAVWKPHIKRLLASCFQLTSLSIGPISLTVKDAEFLASVGIWQKLKELHLVYCVRKHYVATARQIPATQEDADQVDDDGDGNGSVSSGKEVELGIGDNELAIILRHLHSIQTLEISGNGFSDQSLGLVGEYCGAKLQRLTVQAELLTDAGLEKMIRGCVALTGLDLEGCTGLSPHGLQIIISSLEERGGFAGIGSILPFGINGVNGTELHQQQLQKLQKMTSIDSNGGNTGINLDYRGLLSSLTTPVTSTVVTRLAILGCAEIPSIAINKLIKLLPRLQELYLGGSNVTEDALLALCDGIEILGGSNHMAGASATGAGVSTTSNITTTFNSSASQVNTYHQYHYHVCCPDLYRLHLEHCGEISDDIMVPLLYAYRPQLTHLTIFGGTSLTAPTFQAVSRLFRLIFLHFEKVRYILDEAIEAILGKCRQLEVLKLWKCRHLTSACFEPSPKFVAWAKQQEQKNKIATTTATTTAGLSIETQTTADEKTTTMNTTLLSSVKLSSLKELDFVEDYPRTELMNPKEIQMALVFLKSLVQRFENLRVLRVARLGDSSLVNLVSYLCQLDRLEHLCIFQSPSLNIRNIQELYRDHANLRSVGMGIGTPSMAMNAAHLSLKEIGLHNDMYPRPRVVAYERVFSSSKDFQTHV